MGLNHNLKFMLTEKLLDVNQILDIRHTLLHLSRSIAITQPSMAEQL